MMLATLPRMALVSLILAACSAESPEEDVVIGPDAGVPISSGDGGGVIPQAQLSVDQPMTPTAWPQTSLTGAAPPRSLVLIDTPSRGQFSKDVGSDGSFCIDVPLDTGAVNEIRLQAITPDGDYTNEVVVQVEQSGEPPEMPTGGGPTPGGGTEVISKVKPLANTYDGTVAILEGEPADAVDGATGTHVKVKDTWEPWKEDYMRWRLPETVTLDHVRVIADASCQLEEFYIMTSDLADPALWSDWVGFHVNQKKAEHEIHVPANLGDLKTRHIAIWFASRDCGPLTGPGQHVIRELEVFARKKTGDDNPGNGGSQEDGPSCATGGL